MTPRTIAATTLALLSTAAPAAAAKPPYTATPGPSRADARFVVSYQGNGSYATKFHATPPNQGGKPDTNDAHDTSTQSWKVKFRKQLQVPTCGQPQDFGDDPCASLSGLTGAAGRATMVGHVNHKHVDGLYKQFDRTVKCTLRKTPSPKRTLDITLKTTYVPDSNSIAVSVSDPMSTTLSLFPSQCPKQGESIDRILDFYAVPGFSFEQGWGPDLWFASKVVVIPSAVFHHSAKIKIPLRLTAAGTSPRHCRRPNPSYERCTTGGSWSGALTLDTKGTG